MKPLTHGSLFAGIGGFDLGFERAGIRTVWQVEIDEYCRRVLARHFPQALRFSDIRGVGKHCLPQVNILSGGFPCQDISNAGRRIGIDGEKSGLWSEMHRVICELRPKLIVVENVAALLGRGLGRVLGDLASIGYDTEWDCIPALAVGAPHRRDRIWIVAYPRPSLCIASRGNGSTEEGPAIPFAASSQSRCEGHLAYAERTRLHKGYLNQTRQAARCGWKQFKNWEIEPDVGRVAHGVSARVDRLEGLGNSIVPQIAEWIGKRIVETS